MEKSSCMRSKNLKYEQIFAATFYPFADNFTFDKVIKRKSSEPYYVMWSFIGYVSTGRNRRKFPVQRFFFLFKRSVILVRSLKRRIFSL